MVRKTLQSRQLNPGPSRHEPLPGGGELPIDVSVGSHSFGVTFLTISDQATLKEKVPPPNKPDERLRLLRLGSDGETRVLLLYQQNYGFADPEKDGGISRDAAAAALARDVDEFIRYASEHRFR